MWRREPVESTAFLHVCGTAGPYLQAVPATCDTAAGPAVCGTNLPFSGTRTTLNGGCSLGPQHQGVRVSEIPFLAHRLGRLCVS